MLRLKYKHHLDFPHITLSPSPMRLSPVLADDDELTQAIVTDSQAHDDVWELNERPDVNQLTEFWSEVVEDVSNDPKWFKFNEE